MTTKLEIKATFKGTRRDDEDNTVVSFTCDSSQYVKTCAIPAGTLLRLTIEEG